MRVSTESREATLIERARDGEPDALAALYERHARSVMGLAHRITGSLEDAEDVLHDLFLGLPEALHRYEERGHFEGWLKRVAVRIALARLRSQRRRREVRVSGETVCASGASGEGVVNRTALDRALRALPDDLRVVFVLKEIHGYSHAEIGALLGIRTNTSEVRLHRAMKRLRRLLGEEL